MICSNIHCPNYEESAKHPCADCSKHDKKMIEEKDKRRIEYERKHGKRVNAERDEA
jgi:hypothetical protein